MTSSALPTIGTIAVERALERPDLLAPFRMTNRDDPCNTYQSG